MQELLDLRHERMPFFALNGNKREIELRNLPTDGRVVRVALVNVEEEPELPFDDDGTLPTAYDAAVSRLNKNVQGQDYTPSLERTFPLTFEVTKSVRDNPEDARDGIYGGEIWLSFQDGEIKVWQPLPDSCISPPRLNGDTATFVP